MREECVFGHTPRKAGGQGFYPLKPKTTNLGRAGKALSGRRPKPVCHQQRSESNMHTSSTLLCVYLGLRDIHP